MVLEWRLLLFSLESTFANAVLGLRVSHLSWALTTGNNIGISIRSLTLCMPELVQLLNLLTENHLDRPLLSFMKTVISQVAQLSHL